MPRMSTGLLPLVPAPPMATPTINVWSPAPASVRIDRLSKRLGMATPSEETAIWAALLVTEPTALATTAVYVPASPVETELKARVDWVAPAIATPLRYHW